jgi:ComF family protein
MIPAREKLLLLLDKIVDDWAGIAIERPSVTLAGFEQTDGCYWCGNEVGPYEMCVCNERHRSWCRVIRLGNYEPPLSECILSGKYAAWDVGLEYLGAMLGHQIKGCVPPNSILVPVPMPLSRRFFRGINHTKVLALHASRAAGLHMRCPLWRREGAPQASKTASARLKMKHNSMLLHPLARVRGKNVVLIDDVLTTGKTIEIAASKLLSAGVSSIRVAVLAVTKMPKKR